MTEQIRKPVYTVGHEVSYDTGLAQLGPDFMKMGPNKHYAGGYALQSVADAERLIKECEREWTWAVYELDADWDEDTKPSEVGWWRGITRDCVILRKVSSRLAGRADDQIQSDSTPPPK